MHPFPILFGRVLFKTLNLLSQKDYFKAILVLLDLYGSPLFHTKGTTCCFMHKVCLQLLIIKSTSDFAIVFCCAHRGTFSGFPQTILRPGRPPPRSFFLTTRRRSEKWFPKESHPQKRRNVY